MELQEYAEAAKRTYEMGGFEFKPQWVKVKGERKVVILPSLSQQSKKAIMDKVNFRIAVVT
jgi:hypothetical protein